MRTLFAFACLGLASFACADETYLGMYLQGQKIGYSSYSSQQTSLDGKPALRNDSVTKMGAGLLGAGLEITIDSTTWTSPNGRPLRMKFAMGSGGRTQKVDAKFDVSAVLVDIDNSGTITKKTLKIPTGAPIVDDPLTLVLAGNQARTFYVLDPTTVSFVKNEVKILGVTSTMVHGKPVSGKTLQVIDPRAVTKVWVTSKGDLIRVEAPMGIEMLPISRKEALGKATTANPMVDLAQATSLKTDKLIEDPADLRRLKLRFVGKSMANVPSDGFQTVEGSGVTWTIDVHPPTLDAGGSASIAAAAAQKPDWVKPGLNMPSDSPRFKTLAAEIVGERSDVRTASLRIRDYVHKLLKPNAGIGVLRDANDVLTTKEGVCRDYAILTGTLCRAAGIPARLVSGLVNWDGTFYYHAWVEVWDGRRWLGMDSTADSEQISAAHVKLADGNVEDAFTFTFLDRVKVSVLDFQREK